MIFDSRPAFARNRLGLYRDSDEDQDADAAETWGRASSVLLAFVSGDTGGDLDPAQSAGVLRDAAIQRLGDALAIFGGRQLTLVGRIADKRDLRQDRRHVGPNQDDKGRFLHPAISHARASQSESAL